MNLIGDIKNANKFCVNTPDKGIIFVPSFDIAKQYVSDPKNKDWYGQTIIASYEQVVKAEDGKFYFKSQAPKKELQQQLLDTIEIFKQQSVKKIKTELQKYAEQKGFESFLELISFSTSKIKTYKTLAKDAISYRDEIYSYTDNFFNELDVSVLKNLKDLSSLYDKYLKNFPFM